MANLLYAKNKSIQEKGVQSNLNWKKDEDKTAKLPARSNAGVIGLTNNGNTCYLNSVLQCLLNTNEVVEGLRSDEIRTTNPIARSFSSLAKIYHNATDSVNPMAFYHEILKTYNQYFEKGRQEDAAELFLLLIDNLQDNAIISEDIYLSNVLKSKTCKNCSNVLKF